MLQRKLLQQDKQSERQKRQLNRNLIWNRNFLRHITYLTWTFWHLLTSSIRNKQNWEKLFWNELRKSWWKMAILCTICSIFISNPTHSLSISHQLIKISFFSRSILSVIQSLKNSSSKNFEKRRLWSSATKLLRCCFSSK